MRNIFQCFIAPALFALATVSSAASGATNFQKIRLSLDMSEIEDVQLKSMALDAANDISNTIGGLVHVVLHKEEIAKKIGWDQASTLLLAPESSCGAGVGMITPEGRPIIRATYAFMKGYSWRGEGNNSLFFLAEFEDPVVQENVAVFRYFFSKKDGVWRLVKQEVVRKNIVQTKC